MTLSQIECFLIVSEKLSFTKAGEILYVSQPAISRRISLLEEEIGVKLFYRNNSKLELTAAGTSFAQLFRKFLDDYNQTLAASQKANSQIEGNIRIGCADGWDISPFYSKAKEFLKSVYPNINLSLDFYDHEDLIKKITKRELDLVIDQQELFSEATKICLAPLWKSHCIVMYAKSNPIAKQKDLTLASFKDCTFFLRSSDNLKNTNMGVIQQCQRAGFIPKIEYVVSQSAAYAKLLSEDGVFYADEHIIELHNSLFDHIVLPYERTICLVSNQDKSQVCSLVEKTLIDCCYDLYGPID